MASEMGKNPFTAYLRHLSEVPLGIYKTRLLSNGFSEVPTNLTQSRLTSIIYPPQDAKEPREADNQTLYTAKTNVETHKTPSHLNLPLTERSTTAPAPGSFLTFSTLSSTTVQSEKSKHQPNNSMNSASSTLEDIPSRLWAKISRISACLHNIMASTYSETSGESNSHFIAQLTDSSTRERLALNCSSSTTSQEIGNKLSVGISADFDTSLGSSDLVLKNSTLKQIGEMIKDVIKEGSDSGLTISFSSSDKKDYLHQIDQLVKQYNAAATLFSGTQSEIPLITMEYYQRGDLHSLHSDL